jgi:hypothetical protein
MEKSNQVTLSGGGMSAHETEGASAMGRAQSPPPVALQSHPPGQLDQEGRQRQRPPRIPPPDAGPDANAPAPPAVAQPLVVFNPVQSPTTPVGMPHRIPPRRNTPVAATVQGWNAAMGPIRIAIEQAGNGNGNLQINGGTTTEINSTSILNLQGTSQTEPGHTGNLRLVAQLGTTIVGRSAGFSVSAIPQRWHTRLMGPYRDTHMAGITVQNAWESDSGEVADLDRVERRERLAHTATGALAGRPAGHPSGALPGTDSPIDDTHTLPLSWLTGEGEIAVQQAFTFNDERTMSYDVPGRDSGYSIRKVVTRRPGGGLDLTVTKTGAMATAEGFTVSAGSGEASASQRV